jgi:hypothetical protein
MNGAAFTLLVSALSRPCLTETYYVSAGEGNDGIDGQAGGNLVEMSRWPPPLHKPANRACNACYRSRGRQKWKWRRVYITAGANATRTAGGPDVHPRSHHLSGIVTHARSGTAAAYPRRAFVSEQHPDILE